MGGGDKGGDVGVGCILCQPDVIGWIGWPGKMASWRIYM